MSADDKENHVANESEQSMGREDESHPHGFRSDFERQAALLERIKNVKVWLEKSCDAARRVVNYDADDERRTANEDRDGDGGDGGNADDLDRLLGMLNF